MMETLDEKCKIIIIIKKNKIHSIHSLLSACTPLEIRGEKKKKKNLWAFPIDICDV